MELMAPVNGDIDCSLGGDGQPTHGDICNFTCNDGFTLRGDAMRECRVRRVGNSWSGEETRCVPGMHFPPPFGLLKTVVYVQDQI